MEEIKKTIEIRDKKTKKELLENIFYAEKVN